MTPLHFAARSGKADVAELLLSFDGIDLTVVDDRGKTSMDAAVANGRQEVVDLLKAHCHYIS
jgi:ankyrin repeat protein